MLSLTRKADYAFVAMAELARRDPEHASARELAETIGVSLPMLTNVLHQLVQFGLVASTKGAKGGYRLSRAARTISLADMIDAVQGTIRLAACCGGDPEVADADCDLERSCRIKEPVRRVHRGLREYLSRVSLADLAFDAKTVTLGLPGDASRQGEAMETMDPRT